MKKNNFLLRQKYNIIPLSIGVVVFAFLICFAVAAWIEPSVAPPGGNIPAPLHVGLCSDTQILQKADGYNWNCVAMPSGGSGEPWDFDCEDCDTRFVNTSGGDTINGSLTVKGDIDGLNTIIGEDFLFIKGNAEETAPLYLAGEEIKMYTNGRERLSIDSRGDVKISNGALILPHLLNCDCLGTDANGKIICSSGGSGDPCDGVACVDKCVGKALLYDGSCVDGKCIHSGMKLCEYGCSNNKCNTEPIDPCDGVTCSTYCSGNILKHSGNCVGGICQYQSTVCAHGCSGNKCNSATGLLPIGATCNSNSQCESGYCSGGVCAEPTGDKKGLGESCSAQSQCQSGYCVDGVCCNNACTGRDCQTCGALSSQGIGRCGYVKSSSADPRNDCSSGSTVSNGCKSNNCSGKNWSCGIVASGQDGGCPACKTCDGVNASCKNYPNNVRDTKGAKTCKGCKYCIGGSCVNITSGDPFNECGTTGCGTGDCNGSGKCGWFTSGEHNCSVCRTCQGATSASCKYFGSGAKDDEGSKKCNTDHKRCTGSGSCSAPTSANQTGCLNLGSNNCSGYCPGWCVSNSMCESCMVPSMRVYSNDSCSGTGSGVFSGSCNQSGGRCKCFYVKYQYPY